MNNAPFKAIPKNEEFKISFKLESNLLVDWLLALSKQGSKNACLQILYLLQTLKKTKLSTKKRLSFLNTISDYLQQYINLLEDSCWDASFPLSEAELDYAQIISWNYLVLAENFFIAAENTLVRDDNVFSLYKALCCIGQTQLHIAATYGNPCEGFWSLLYQIFARAEKQNLLKLEINETNLKGVTVNTTFAQILIFQLCDTRQFHPREMQCIFNFLAKVCEGLVFYKVTDLQFQTEILKISYLTAINTITYSFKSLVDHLTNKLIGRQDLMLLQ
jgi:hypothetical protein